MVSSIGVLGSACLIVAFFLQQRGTLTIDKPLYHVLNAFGAFFILVSLTVEWNLFQFILEVFWLAVSLFGLWMVLKRAKADG